MGELDGAYLIILFLLGVGAFLISTLSAGGGALLLVPVLNFLIGSSQTAPVLNLGTFIGRPARLVIFWKHINWKVCLYYAPAAIGGSALSGWLFSQIKIEWLSVFVGLFLISTIFQYRFGKKERSFSMKLIYFVPLGFIVSFLGTLIGALGPVLNPFYINLGLEKEELIATKTANSFLMGVSQLSSYTFFGVLTGELWIYGLSLGLGATIGNVVGKQLLKRMKKLHFLRFMIALMVISGLIMVIRQVIQWLP